MPGSLHDRLRRFPRFGSAPSRRELAKRHGLETVDRLSYNESPLGPSEAVREAVRAEADRLGDYPPFADEPLREAVVRQIGRGLTIDHVVAGAGAYEVLELLTRAMIEPGDEVVLSLPTFEASPRIVGLEGGVVVDVPLLRPSFRLDVDGILGAITERTRMVWVCHPNNPSGVAVTSEEMERLVSELPERVLLLADEAYHQFVRMENGPDTVAYLVEGRPNVAVVHSLSKAYGLAGLRLGYALVPPWLGDLTGRLHRAFHLNRVHLAAGVAALGDQEHVERVVDLVLGEREKLARGLEALGLETLPSQTNFVMVSVPRPAAEVAAELLEEGLQVRALADLGLDHHVRINVGRPEANERLLRVLSDLLRGRS